MKTYVLPLFLCMAIAAIAADVGSKDLALIDRAEMGAIDEKILEIKEADKNDPPYFYNIFYYPPKKIVGVDSEGAPIIVIAQPTEPKLESIIGSRAMINGKWKKEGDTTIGNWKLEKIDSSAVVLVRGNSRRTLSMKGDGVKKQNFINKVGG